MPRPHLDDRAGPPAPAFHFLSAQPQPHVPWLWHPRIPLAALTLLVGDPGTGKSLLTIDLAARLSRPRPWPDEPSTHSLPGRGQGEHPPSLLGRGQGEGSGDREFLPRAPAPTLPPSSPDAPCLLQDAPAAPVGVVFAAPEDQPALAARLAAAAADPAHICVVDGVRDPVTDDVHPLRLPTHLDQLDEAVRAHDHPRLVVLDPLHLLLDDGTDRSLDLQVSLLAHLAGLARRRHVAILAVGHFAKTWRRQVIHRIRGSMTLLAAARSILRLTTDPADPDRRILAQIKNTYGPFAPPLAFRIRSAHQESPFPLPPRGASPTRRSTIPSLPRPRQGEGSGNRESPPRAAPPARPPSHVPTFPPSHADTPCLLWDDPALPDWRLSAAVLDLSPDAFSLLSEACDWLADFLSAGPRPARAVLTAARAAGIPRTTLFRAKRLLNIPSRKTGPTWTWLAARPDP